MTFERRIVAGRPTIVAAGSESLPPVLLVHGAFSNPEQLQTLQGAFSAAGFATYAPALRGHDRAAPESVDRLGITAYVDDVRAVAQALDAAPIVVGHSMGGLITTKVLESGLGRAGVLIAAAPPAPVLPTSRSLIVLLREFASIITGRTMAPPAEALRQLALNAVEPSRHAEILQGFVPESGVAFRDMILGRIRVNRDAIRVPLLAVVGGRDRLVPPWQMRSTARKLGAEIQLHSSCGHFPFEEPTGAEVITGIIDWCLRISR